MYFRHLPSAAKENMLNLLGKLQLFIMLNIVEHSHDLRFNITSTEA